MSLYSHTILASDPALISIGYYLCLLGDGESGPIRNFLNEFMWERTSPLFAPQQTPCTKFKSERTFHARLNTLSPDTLSTSLVRPRPVLVIRGI